MLNTSRDRQAAVLLDAAHIDAAPVAVIRLP
jgi:hypothetical protein